MVTVGPWLTAGNLVNQYATEAYLEVPAIAVTAGALLLLTRALERGTRSAWAWAGAGAMVAYLTKTDYGLILMFATGAGTLLSALWFAFPAKVPATVAALVNREQGPPTLSHAGLTFHFAALVRWTDGFAMWGLALLAFGATALRPRADLLRVVIVSVALAFLLHTLSQTKVERHIVKVVPWLFVMIGVQAARLRKAPRPARTGAETIVDAIGRRARSEASHVVIGGFGAVSAHYVNWTVLGNNPHATVIPDPMTKTGYTHEAFQGRMATLRHRMPLLGALVELVSGSPEKTQQPLAGLQLLGFHAQNPALRKIDREP